MDVAVKKPIRARTAIPYGLIALGAAGATIAGALVFQAYGYAPCELCLKERLPYYVGIPLSAITSLSAWRGPILATKICFALLILLFVFSAGFGAYHAGVEWRFWPGPSDCTGTLDHAASNQDFLRQLNTFKAVRCDAVAIRIVGLSLAGWNALISLAIAMAAAWGLIVATKESTA